MARNAISKTATFTSSRPSTGTRTSKKKAASDAAAKATKVTQAKVAKEGKSRALAQLKAKRDHLLDNQETTDDDDDMPQQGPTRQKRGGRGRNHRAGGTGARGNDEGVGDGRMGDKKQEGGDEEQQGKDATGEGEDGEKQPHPRQRKKGARTTTKPPCRRVTTAPPEDEEDGSDDEEADERRPQSTQRRTDGRTTLKGNKGPHRRLTIPPPEPIYGAKTKPGR